MATSAGTSAFMRQDVNQCFKDMLDEYCSFLSSPGSTDVLDADPDGWFSTGALKAMGEVASQANPDEPISFEEAYTCNPENSHYGFKSWDEFFIREFRPGVRPLPDDNTDAVIVGCCESTPYKLSTNVQLRDQFWAKGQPYSLQDMLGNYDDAQVFVGGTCYQAFLSALSYHRWHSPIDGIVKKIYHIPGTYYAENYWEGFANIDPDTKEPVPDPAAPNDSQAFISSVATCLVFIIESSNETLGTVGIVQIGMAEVSTCQPTVEVGQKVSKGDQLGMVCSTPSLYTVLSP
jgi:phosphatidylserine decarboxylase